MTDLLIAPCSHEAAKYAVLNWHYSHRVTVGKMFKVGAWEIDDTGSKRFIGAVCFARGANKELGTQYGLTQNETTELVRVALCPQHDTPTTQVVAGALALLKKGNPGLRLVVSFADPQQGHIGVIYQAGNWVYAGKALSHGFRVKGVLYHPKSLHSALGGQRGAQSLPWLRANIDPNAERVELPPKLRYLMPLDRAMRRRVESFRQDPPRELGNLGAVDGDRTRPSDLGSQ